MKKHISHVIFLGISLTFAAFAQSPSPVPGTPEASPAPAHQAVNIESVQSAVPASNQPSSAGEMTATGGQPSAVSTPTQESPAPSPVASEEQSPGTWVKDMPLNDLFSVLARRIGYQYFSNPVLSTVTVQGQLLDSVKTMEQMQDLGLQYGVTIYERNRTLYALRAEQVASMPRREWTYKLKYLNVHTKDERESLAQILQPALSANGVVQFESMTRTVVIMDNEYALQAVQGLLEKIDRPQKQVIVKVQILRMINNASNQFGVDWAESLGKGIQVGATAYGPVDQIFNTTPVFGDYGQIGETINTAIANILTGGNSTGSTGTTTTGGTTGTGTGTTGTTAASLATSGAIPAGIVLTPIQVSAVIRALVEKDAAVQESGPTVIIKDNQQGSFSIVELIPIITQQVSQSNGTNLISTSVSYEIDPQRDTAVGLQVKLRPSVLPDNTIEMLLQPSIATITGYTVAQTGVAGITNSYPNVHETSVDSIARIPDGFSLVLSGYYQIEEREKDNKVPLLGDIPGISFAFRSKSREKVRSNVLFVITPTTYDPTNQMQTVEFSEMIKQQTTPPKNLDYPDNEMPGEDTSPNLLQRMRNMLPGKPKAKPRVEIDPDNELNTTPHPKLVTPQQKEQDRIRQQLREEKAKKETVQ